jgi:NH3-dependent NAD+ synthetase
VVIDRYMTKYDCSSGDLNPIGSISKGDLKKLLGWASQVNLPPDSNET